MDENRSFDEELHVLETNINNKRKNSQSAPLKSNKKTKSTVRPSVDASAWNLGIELQFIGIMEQYPQIWNASEADLRYSGKKQTLWEEITARVPFLKPLHWSQVRQKWANYVNSYTKIAAQRRVTKSGQAADCKPITWPYWEAMSYYHKSRVTNTVVSESNLPLISPEIDIGEEVAETTNASNLQFENSRPTGSRILAATQLKTPSPSPSNASGKPLRKSCRRDVNTDRAKALQALEQVSATMKELVQNSTDPHAQFGSFVIATLNQLPERYQRTAQLQIKKILADLTAKSVNEELLAEAHAQEKEIFEEVFLLDEDGDVLGAGDESDQY